MYIQISSKYDKIYEFEAYGDMIDIIHKVSKLIKTYHDIQVEPVISALMIKSSDFRSELFNAMNKVISDNKIAIRISIIDNKVYGIAYNSDMRHLNYIDNAEFHVKYNSMIINADRIYVNELTLDDIIANPVSMIAISKSDIDLKKKLLNELWNIDEYDDILDINNYRQCIGNYQGCYKKYYIKDYGNIGTYSLESNIEIGNDFIRITLKNESYNSGYMRYFKKVDEFTRDAIMEAISVMI